MRVLALLGFLVAAVYPLLVYVGLDHFEPRYLGVLLAGVFVLRHGRAAARGLRGWAVREKAAALALIALVAGVAVTNSEPLLLLYPAFVSAIMLALFAGSLARPPSVVERLARARGRPLGPEAVRYTYRVTQIWCGFFLMNGALAAYTALYASRAAWVFYNGLVAYLLMGALFAGEWLYRRRRFGLEPVK